MNLNISNDTVNTCTFNGNDIETLIFNGDIVWQKNTPYVDLGLPSGLLWAKCNLGADNNYDYGDYYAWGEITTKSSYTSDNYSASAATGDIAGTDYDAATVKLGSKWSMPTQTQCDELVSGTYNGWTSNYNGTGVAGYIFFKKVDGKTSFSAYSLSDTHIFMPAAGYYDGSTLYGAGSYGNYWSSTYYDSNRAYYLGFDSGYCGTGRYGRYCGQSIRAVYNP